MVTKCRQSFLILLRFLMVGYMVIDCGFCLNETEDVFFARQNGTQLEHFQGRNGNSDISNNLARKKGGSSSNQGSLMERLLPMLIIPFLISSALIPGMLFSIKFLLVKSAVIGKIAVFLMLINFFRRRSDQGGVFNHYPQDLAKEHYGYQGVEEPGVYVNKRRRR